MRCLKKELSNTFAQNDLTISHYWSFSGISPETFFREQTMICQNKNCHRTGAKQLFTKGQNISFSLEKLITRQLQHSSIHTQEAGRWRRDISLALQLPATQLLQHRQWGILVSFSLVFVFLPVWQLFCLRTCWTNYWNLFFFPQTHDIFIKQKVSSLH